MKFLFVLLLCVLSVFADPSCSDFYQDLQWEINQYDENHIERYPWIMDDTKISFEKLDFEFIDQVKRIDRLPDSIQYCPFSEVTLTGVKLRSVGNGFSKLSQLTDINLSNNKLTSLPDFTGMPKLRTIDISKNFLKSLPSVRNSLLFTTYIADHNYATTIPSGLAGTKVDKVDLSYNRLSGSALNEGLSLLRILDLSFNELKSIPSFIDSSYHLGELKLKGNKISGSVNNNWSKLVSLTTLDLSHNSITKLDKSIYVDSITSFDASYNLITEVEMTRMPKIDSFNIAHNKLTELPTFQPMSLSMSLLDASGNKITEIKDLKRMTITTLDLSGNKLSTKAVDTLASLKVTNLLLNYCGLSTLKKVANPEDAKDTVLFDSVKYLHLDGNEFTTLPITKDQFQNVLTLYINHNKVPKFAEAKEHPTVQTIHIESNELKELADIPPTVTTLYANNNAITKVNAADVASISTLHLAFNKIATVEELNKPGATVNLGFNEIKTLPAHIIANKLYLDGNDLSGVSLNENHITGCGQVYMRLCKITALPAYKYLNSGTLDLSYNPITSHTIPKDYAFATFVCNNCGIIEAETYKVGDENIPADYNGVSYIGKFGPINVLELNNNVKDDLVQSLFSLYPNVPPTVIKGRVDVIAFPAAPNALKEASFWATLPPVLTNLELSGAIPAEKYANNISTDADKGYLKSLSLKVLNLSKNVAVVDFCGRFNSATLTTLNIAGTSATLEGCLSVYSKITDLTMDVQDNMAAILNMNEKNTGNYKSVYPFTVSGSLTLRVNKFSPKLCDLMFVAKLYIKDVTDVGKVFSEGCAESLSKTDLVYVKFEGQDTMSGRYDDVRFVWLTDPTSFSVDFSRSVVVGRPFGMPENPTCIFAKDYKYRTDKVCAKPDNSGDGYAPYYK